MKRLAVGIIAGLTLMLGACGGQQAQPQTPAPSQQPSGAAYDAAAAESTFKANCAACHGSNLEGQVGPKLSDVGSRYSKDQILQIIQNGKNGRMPGGLVSGKDAENLAAWLADKK